MKTLKSNYNTICILAHYAIVNRYDNTSLLNGEHPLRSVACTRARSQKCTIDQTYKLQTMNGSQLASLRQVFTFFERIEEQKSNRVINFSCTARDKVR